MSKFKKLWCPICTLVAGSWILILLGIWLGFLDKEAWLLPVGILMGGSVVGATYKISDSMKFKLIFIPIGFVTAYTLLESLWGLFLAGLLILLVVAVFGSELFLSSGESRALKEKMKNCC